VGLVLDIGEVRHRPRRGAVIIASQLLRRGSGHAQRPGVVRRQHHRLPQVQVQRPQQVYAVHINVLGPHRPVASHFPLHAEADVLRIRHGQVRIHRTQAGFGYRHAGGESVAAGNAPKGHCAWACAGVLNDAVAREIRELRATSRKILS